MSDPRRVGPFDVVERLGAGGMAEVFVGRAASRMPGDPVLVALKRALPAMAAQVVDVEKMFLAEASILSRLHHKNIVKLLDITVCDGSTYVVMELLLGVDLSLVIKTLARLGAPLPFIFSAHVCAEIADALAYVASLRTPDGRILNIVHRDISPQNIFITVDNQVKLLDFGVARADERILQTRAGVLKGKLPYMSPEQASSTPLTGLSDVFSLGTVLYELTVGRRPFRAKGEFAILKEVVDCNITWPTALYSSYPKELEGILKKMLARAPEDRLTAAQAAAALRAFLDTQPTIAACTPKGILERYFTQECDHAHQLLETANQESQVTHLSSPGLDVDFALNVDAPGVADPETPRRQAAVVKDFNGETTTLHIHDLFPNVARWRRVMDGLEGRVNLVFEPSVTLTAQSQSALLNALEGLGSEVTSLTLTAVPPALLEGLNQRPALAARAAASSSLLKCPQCGTAWACPPGQAPVCENCQDTATKKLGAVVAQARALSAQQAPVAAQAVLRPASGIPWGVAVAGLSCLILAVVLALLGR